MPYKFHPPKLFLRRLRSSPLLLTVSLLLFLFLLVSSLLFYFYLTANGSRLFSKLTKSGERGQYGLVQMLKLYDLPYILFSWTGVNNLPKYSLIIDPDDWQFLNANLPKEGLLTDEYKVSVPAHFLFAGGAYPVNVRYRGDKPNHWRFTKKSWRIVFEGKSPLGDVKRLNLILPEDRGFYSEALAFFVAGRLGLFTLENDFVELAVNGRPMGVYFMVEHWSKEALARNQLDPDTNLYGGDNDAGFPENLYSSAAFFKKYVAYSGLPEEERMDLEKLLKYLNTLDDEDFFEQIPTILDIDQFLTWQAHSQLLFNYNYGKSHNTKLVLNQATGKFEFLSWDMAMLNPADNTIYSFDYNPLMERVLAKPMYLCQRDQILLDYVSRPENLLETLNYLDELYQTTRWEFYRDYKKLFLNLHLDIRTKILGDWLVSGHEKIREETAISIANCKTKGLL